MTYRFIAIVLAPVMVMLAGVLLFVTLPGEAFAVDPHI